MTPRCYHTWTAEEDDLLVSMWRDGKNTQDIAETVGVQESQVHSRLKTLRANGNYGDIEKRNVTRHRPYIPHRVSIAECKAAICEKYRISEQMLVNESHMAAFVKPRQIGMALSYLLSGQSTTVVGKHFGNRDHTTVMHACKRVEQLYQDELTELSQRLTEAKEAAE